MASCNRFGSSLRGRRCASTSIEMRPARSSTFRCLEMAGWLISKGSASSVTVASPVASRARMARRVGSARAAKVKLRRSEVCIAVWFHNCKVIYKDGNEPVKTFRNRETRQKRGPKTRKPGRSGLNALALGFGSRWPSGPSHAHRTTQGFFCHGLEALALEGALPLQVLANGDQLVVADALLEPRSIGLGAHQPCISHLNETRVRGHQ